MKAIENYSSHLPSACLELLDQKTVYDIHSKCFGIINEELKKRCQFYAGCISWTFLSVWLLFE